MIKKLSFLILIFVFSGCTLDDEQIDTDLPSYQDDIRSIEEILKSLRDVPNLEEALTREDLDDAYLFEETFWDMSNYKIIRYSNDEGGDRLIAGGCELISFFYAIEVENGIYSLDEQNLRALLDPKSHRQYLEYLKIYQFLKPSFCGITNYFALNDYRYEVPEEFNSQCIIEETISVASALEIMEDKAILSFYQENISYPITLSLQQLVFDGDEISMNLIEKVYECEEGYSF